MVNAFFSRIVVFFLYLVSLLPFWFLYLISDLIFLILYHIVKYRRDVVQGNLGRSFPNKSSAELQLIEKQYYEYLADMMIESVKMISLPKKSALKHFVYTNPEILETYFSAGRSVVAAAGHYANWEMGNVMPLCNSGLNMVVYKPLANKVFENLFHKIRTRYGAVMVPMKLALRKIVEYRKQITLSVFVSDQTPHYHETQYFTTFLNQTTAIFLGIEKIAKLTNSPVVFLDVRLVKRGYYTCTFVPLIENPQETAEHEITEAHVRYLEKMIMEKPQYWLWSHKRWKFNEQGFIG
ncbi:MAG: lauroyl acyltransferase [Sphingobacteriaceae bacterium]|nr:lauroyl acyltransferase [Sphingobacteriaceae bacterium]